MAHINVPEHVPGIRSLALFSPHTAEPLYKLAQVLLRTPHGLMPAERELIATYVSHLNNCMFCRNSHAAAARCLYGNDHFIVDDVLQDMNEAPVSNKLKALLTIAGKVQVSGKLVTQQMVNDAKIFGATDEDIHDTVLIAATFSMFNRYVDGLNSYTPEDAAAYVEMGERLATKGYTPPAQ